MKRQFLLFLAAMQFLTRLPVSHLDGFQANGLSRSARFFPLVGALIGSIGVGVWWLGSMYLPPAVAVGLMMSASLLLTGAFHEDGFADACDGFGGGRTRDAVLSIMKDSRVGAYGAIVIGAHVVSRWCAISLIWRLQYVRTDGDGKSKTLAGNLGAADWLLSGALG